MKRYLFIGIADQPLLIGLVTNLKKKDPSCRVDVLAIKPVKNNSNVYDKIYKLTFYEWYLLNIKHGSSYVIKLCLLFWCFFQKNKYDLIELHYCDLFHASMIRFYRRFCTKVVAILWGSDIFRLPERLYPVMKKLLLQCDIINCSTLPMRDKIKMIMGKEFSEKKITQCLFGLELLNKIQHIVDKSCSKDELANVLELQNYNKNLMIITIGSNGSEGQQHLDIIDSLSNINFNNVYFILPLTYGLSQEYYRKIKQSLIGFKSPSYCLTKFMTTEQIASLRLITDVFIQLQITDALSGAMQEHLYAKNIVITGSWLNYDILKNNGVYYEMVDNVKQIGMKLKSVVENYHLIKKSFYNNSEKIWDLSSWEHCIDDWLKF